MVQLDEYIRQSHRHSTSYDIKGKTNLPVSVEFPDIPTISDMQEEHYDCLKDEKLLKFYRDYAGFNDRDELQRHFTSIQNKILRVRAGSGGAGEKESRGREKGRCTHRIKDSADRETRRADNRTGALKDLDSHTHDYRFDSTITESWKSARPKRSHC